MERDTIFISHATPEDNNFAVWLASRLKALGYVTWVDKLALIGGEKFWQEIDQTIRYKTVKFILVYSNNICVNKQFGHLRDGIEKELSLAESIGKENKLKDFIILLNVDSSSYNQFIGADRLNQISFRENWAEGLKMLLEKFKKDLVPKSQEAKSEEFATWYENELITKNGIIPKKELYYSSFWRISSLPDEFFLYQFESEDEAKQIYLSYKKFPVAKVSNILISFVNDLPLTYGEGENKCNAKLKSKINLSVQDTLDGSIEQIDSFGLYIKPENYLKPLLTRVFHLLMKGRKLSWYELANKTQAYFHTRTSLDGCVRFKYPYRKTLDSKRKHLYGKYLSLGFWHYAISCKSFLTPLLGYSLKSHIIFTTDGHKPWEDKDKMHSHRRTKGRRFFNAEWRDMYLGFIQSLQDSNGDIKMTLNESSFLIMPCYPEMLWSDFGYYEPSSKDRLNIDDSLEKGDYYSNEHEF